MYVGFSPELQTLGSLKSSYHWCTASACAAATGSAFVLKAPTMSVAFAQQSNLLSCMYLGHHELENVKLVLLSL